MATLAGFGAWRPWPILVLVARDFGGSNQVWESQRVKVVSDVDVG